MLGFPSRPCSFLRTQHHCPAAAVAPDPGGILDSSPPPPHHSLHLSPSLPPATWPQAASLVLRNHDQTGLLVASPAFQNLHSPRTAGGSSKIINQITLLSSPKLPRALILVLISKPLLSPHTPKPSRGDGALPSVSCLRASACLFLSLEALPAVLQQLFPVPLTDRSPPQPLPAHPHSVSVLTLASTRKRQLHGNAGSRRAETESIPSAAVAKSLTHLTRSGCSVSMCGTKE